MTRLSTALADRYRIERQIGSGGMATVYLARDVKHDRDVAVKVLRPELAAVLGTDRFLNEIRIAARLDHPHILTLIDSGAAGGLLYYVMPFVRGESLRHKLEREKQLGVDDALDLTRQITSALDHAHRHGIVHRDIKPENILIHEGEAMLADFGIAMAVKEAGGNRLTESGVSLGTPQYMSPEQAAGDRAPDARSDVYSMAAVLYEMLAGEPPHIGASIQAVIAKLLTEQPVRLRVLRDTVPEGVDTAVARALAKLPADRFASAAEFARALATRGSPQRTSARSRRWLPIAIGGAVTAAVAAVATSLILAARPAERVQPERIQVTVTGLAGDPSFSPDTTRIAFEEKQCDEAGYCTFQLVIQDIDGHNRLVITRNVANFFRTAWTPNGAYLVYHASYGSENWGNYGISSLGGAPRFLGRGGFDFVSGDTAIMATGFAGDSVGWVRRITVHDGQTVDSIKVRDPGGSFDEVALTSPTRLLLAVRKTPSSPAELRLIDLRGEVIDRVTPAFGSLGGVYGIRWVPSRKKLVFASQRLLGGKQFDVLSMDVTASRIGPDIDTVFSGVQMTHPVFDISPDGQRLIYAAGPVEGTLWTIDTHHPKAGRFTATQALPTTTRLQARISPDGDRILLAQEIPTSEPRASDISIRPRNGGTESPLARAVPNLLEFEWSRDGATILYLHAIEGKRVRLTESDTLGHRIREIEFERSAAIAFYPLPDGAVFIIPEGRRSLSIVTRRGTDSVTWRAPSWIATIESVSLSPDAKSLAVLAVDSAVSAVVVAVVDMENGHFAKLGSVDGEWLGRIRWLEDESIMFDVYEAQGGLAVYATRLGGPIRRFGALPFADAVISASRDGRHTIASSFSVKNDVYMIRNFGKMLRR